MTVARERTHTQETGHRTQLSPSDVFADRHIGPSSETIARMLTTLGVASVEELIDQTIPAKLRIGRQLDLPAARTERQALSDLKALSEKNEIFRSYIGLGYHGTITPAVILRNILENPGWYTQYTPYQAEISQGRLEALLNFQTIVLDLTGMEVANSSLLDEATAAAEAMTLCRRVLEKKKEATTFLVSDRCHPQTIAVVKTRAEPLGYEVRVSDPNDFVVDDSVFGVLMQYPNSDGAVVDPRGTIAKVHAADALVVMATDLLSLTLLTPPGELGADIVVGNSQRFGVPLFHGGPHAAFMTCRADYQRRMPGRIVGLSRDSNGKPALRLALQTREQHIRRDRATSNICTAQVLLAITASMYAVYHGPSGLRRIAKQVHAQARLLAQALTKLGASIHHDAYFDTLRVTPTNGSGANVVAAARAKKINLRQLDGDLVIALDETVTADDLVDLIECFGGDRTQHDLESELGTLATAIPDRLQRTSDFLTHPTFHRYQTEHELLRYMKTLENRDLSLTHSMISLGSCTMKLNATAEMIPVSYPGFSDIHPFAPADQTTGYEEMITRLEAWLCEITGFDACSMQPNAGSQGEYAGLLTIRAYHHARGDRNRDVCLIPTSAHGTNPASAVLAGMRVVPVKCDNNGNIDLADLEAKATKHRDQLSSIMVTYPSTHGVFEETIRDLCRIVHDNGGQVYLDGANMNALVGLVQPGELGADVCHLNLHKTFCIPHGGGGPGMGPICVASHLTPHLPGHPSLPESKDASGAVSAAANGSPGILPISYAYIAMMGTAGLERATQVAILNANYIAHRLDPHFPVLYRGKQGRVAHECIVDLREISKRSHISIDDVAKRLIDYGFHAPTMAWPVEGTLMIEPTESESLEELDRFCDALIQIREEIRAVEEGRFDAHQNPLTGAPHTAEVLIQDDWNRPYSRETAAFPTPDTRARKFWPHVGRIDSVYGDRNLCCTWTPPSE